MSPMNRIQKHALIVFGIANLIALVFLSQTYLAYTSLNRPFIWKEQLVTTFLTWNLWGAFFPAIVALARRFRFERGSYLTTFLIHFLAGSVIATVQILIQTVTADWLLKIPIPWNRLFDGRFGASELGRIFVYFAILTICTAIDLYRRSRETQIESSRIEAGILKAQIESLKMQIDPDFLFRSLGQLSSVMRADLDEADTMVARLGDYLRMTLDVSKTPEVTLREEIAFFNCYLDVENTSLRRRVHVELSADPAALDCLVPALILQAPVEDAVRYRPASSAPAQLKITASTMEEFLLLTIADLSVSGAPEGARLHQLAERWNALYRPPIRIRTSSGTDGHRISIEVPLQLEKRNPGEPLPFESQVEQIEDLDFDLARGQSPVRKWLIIIGIFTLLAVWFTFQTMMLSANSGTVINWPVQLLNIAGWYIWALMTPILLRLAARFPLGKEHFARNLGIHFVGFVSSWVFASFSFAVVRWLANLGDYSFLHMLPTNFARSPYSLDIICYSTIVAVQQALSHSRRIEAMRLRTLTLNTQLARARLHALKMQLHPHFLFNALNSLSELMQEDPAAAEEMIAHLEKFLRLTLDSGQVQEIPFEEELEFLRCYLAIENIRFQDRLNVRMDIEPQALSVSVPNLVLQPIVENAIKHGVAPRTSAGRIEIKASRENGMLRVSVRDNGPGLSKSQKKMAPARPGLGLSNTRERLEQLYGADHRFELINAPEGGLIVTVEIPVHPGSAK